ncbi:MAG: FAD-dependent oxidoreductase [Robiginitalea sp.]
MRDYIVVGSGLAGVAMAETLIGQGHSVVVFDNQSQKASMVAGGLYNPVVLKRLNLAWEGSRLMDFSIPFYEALQARMGVVFDEKIRVMRLLSTAREQNDWYHAADQPGLSEFLVPQIEENPNACLEAPFGLGEVRHTGRIHTARFLGAYREALARGGNLREEAFRHQNLKIKAEGVSYEGLKARAVIFCEGFGLQENPYFNYLPLNGTKGELLRIHAPDLKESRVIKSGVFLIPLGEDRYLVGATYSWKDKSPGPTEVARQEMLRKLRKFLRCDFQVEGQQAGIRPTVPDRRPLVGRHPGLHNLYVLNGLGSRGVLIAPYAAHCLYHFMEEDTPLPEAMDCARFRKRYEKAGQQS